jgi:hypothetical protein
MKLFPWAPPFRTRAGLKMHTVLNIQTKVPTIAIITASAVQDMCILDQLLLEQESLYIMDRGYFDFTRLYAMHIHRSYFIIRSKKRIQFRHVASHAVDTSTGVQYDHTIRLTGRWSIGRYPEELRRIRFLDTVSGKRLIFLTNNFHVSSETIALLYKERWRIELFFKWIKQHLRIRAFYGVSENAVKTQLYIALSTYLLIAILKETLQLDKDLYRILQILSVSLFEKTSTIQALLTSDCTIDTHENENQLILL